jgi:hypothetical protein
VEFDAEDTWKDVKAEIGEVNVAALPGEPLLHMDYVAVRRCKALLRQGRKYIRFFPGDGREEEATTILLLAGKYLGTVTNERSVREEAHASRVSEDGVLAVTKQLRTWLDGHTPLVMAIQATFFQMFYSGHLEETRGEVFLFRATDQQMYSAVQPGNFDVARLMDRESRPTVLLEKFSRGKWQGRVAFFEPSKEEAVDVLRDFSMPSRAVN